MVCQCLSINNINIDAPKTGVIIANIRNVNNNEIVINGKKTILMRGQGTFVPMGQEHLVTALEANSEMFGICMPPEKAYLRE